MLSFLAILGVQSYVLLISLNKKLSLFKNQQNIFIVDTVCTHWCISTICRVWTSFVIKNTFLHKFAALENLTDREEFDLGYSDILTAPQYARSQWQLVPLLAWATASELVLWRDGCSPGISTGTVKFGKGMLKMCWIVNGAEVALLGDPSTRDHAAEGGRWIPQKISHGTILQDSTATHHENPEE